MPTTTFTCSTCHKTITHEHDFTTGYGTDSGGNKHCFACCGELDRQVMIQDGRIALYLVDDEKRVTNWPGTLSFTVLGLRQSRHNIGGRRVDFWFHGPDGHVWHGYQIGQWNQLARCKRTKELWAAKAA